MELLTSNCLHLLEAVKLRIDKAQEKREVSNTKHARPNEFVKGQKVLEKDFKRKRAGGKMDTRYVGPYMIINSLSKGALKHVSDPSADIPRISGSYLKLYK